MSLISQTPALAYWVNSMDPVIFHVWGPLSIRWYGVAYVCGFISAYLLWLLAIKKGRTSITRENMEELLTWGIAGVLLGGRLGYMLLYDFGNFISNPLSLVRIDQGGMSFHGGIAGVALAALFVTLRRKLPAWQIADLIVMAAPLGLLFGRLANFINGELWGNISTVSWAMIFPRAPFDPSEPTVYFETALFNGLANPRHPSQLYEAALEGVVIGAVMLYLYWSRKGFIKKVPGLLFGLFLILYAGARIICEDFREPDASLICDMTRGTFYSLILGAVGVVICGYTATMAFIAARRTKAGKERFDSGAATWDENEERKVRSNAIAAAYGEIIDKLANKPDVMDYGCGTGQSILPVAAKCKSVTGCDFSGPMLEKFTKNAASAGLTNTRTLQCNLSTDKLPDERFDMITSSMTLHHVEDLPAVFDKFAKLLREGGKVALVDLETEDGSFHADMTGVFHKGFDNNWIAKQLEIAGFAQVKVETVYTMTKMSGGKMRDYPLFMACATKK